MKHPLRDIARIKALNGNKTPNYTRITDTIEPLMNEANADLMLGKTISITGMVDQDQYDKVVNNSGGGNVSLT